jgi:hypothetical protein
MPACQFKVNVIVRFFSIYLTYLPNLSRFFLLLYECDDFLHDKKSFDNFVKREELSCVVSKTEDINGSSHQGA